MRLCGKLAAGDWVVMGFLDDLFVICILSSYILIDLIDAYRQYCTYLGNN